MAGFYQAILHEGVPPAPALRNTQIEIWKQKREINLYLLGASTIHGERRPDAEHE